ncbi:MAG: glycosyltransferase [Candidatus Micrarchaeota archaeon]|nr:glycosyltransferase [Candidatus Micrarchaeota archaeon]
MDLLDRAASLAPIIFFILLTIAGITFALYLLYTSSGSMYGYSLAMLFLALAAVSGFFNIFASYSYYRSSLYDDYIENLERKTDELKELPTVAVAVPVYNEDPEIVKKNLLRLKEMDYPSSRIRFYLLDDSTNAGDASELRQFSKRNGYTYIHRRLRTGFKAGALNNMLKHSNEEFIAIFDYDEHLKDKGFLMDLLKYFNDPSVSYIQTEKRYSKGTFFSDTVDLFDAFFFKFIQPSRALNNTAIFAGSCGIIRRSALDAIGGFPEYIVEDTFFSLESDLHRYKSLYIPKVYALGKPIKTFTELVKQQWRYNYGDTQFLGYFMKKAGLLSRKKPLSVMSNIDYITHGFGLNYISTFLIFFTIVSVLIVFSSVPLAKITLQQIAQTRSLTTTMEILGFSTFALSLIAPVVLTKIHFKSIRKGFMVFILNFALAFIRAKAALSAVMNVSPSIPWHTGSGSGMNRKIGAAFRNSISEVVFSSSLFVLGIFAFTIHDLSGGLWLLWYSFLYISTFYFFYKYG